MVAQHKHQYRFFETYWIFRWCKLAEWCKYDWDWSEWIFLYDEHKKRLWNNKQQLTTISLNLVYFSRNQIIQHLYRNSLYQFFLFSIFRFLSIDLNIS